jgi:CelD/BcsL family acetyltransferase involved in cellulose biosynthesis
MNETLRILQSNAEFSQLHEVWVKLLHNSPTDNFFLTWEWCWTWWQYYATTADSLFIVVMEQQGEVTGIAPCYVRKKRLSGFLSVRRLMLLGTQDRGSGDVCSDYMDFIYLKNNETTFLQSLLTMIVKNNACDELQLLRMNTSSPSWEVMHKLSTDLNFLILPSDKYDSPYVKLPATWDDYLNSLSPAMRYKIRRERRKLEKCDTVTITTGAVPESEVNDKFQTLIALHQKRWNSRERSGSFANELFATFHKKVIIQLSKNGWLNLPALSVKNQPKAIFYNFIYKNKFYFYQSGVETAKGLPAYGYLLHSYCIEEAIKQGFSEYDFLPKGGNDGYKDHFANSIRVVASVYMVRGGLLKMYYRLYNLIRISYRFLHYKLIRVAV